jgi:hypothetical protein
MSIKDFGQDTSDGLGFVGRQLRECGMVQGDEETVPAIIFFNDTFRLFKMYVRRIRSLAICSFVQHERRLRAHTTELPLSITLEVHLQQDGRLQTFEGLMRLHNYKQSQCRKILQQQTRYLSRGSVNEYTSMSI